MYTDQEMIAYQTEAFAYQGVGQFAYQSESVPVIPPVSETDGIGGGARIIYKRPHKKLHDEIEEYFAYIGLVPTQEEVSEIAELVAEDIPDLGARAAVAKAIRAQALEVLAAREQTQELRELMARAQDEDDAVAVLVMMETLH